MACFAYIFPCAWEDHCKIGFSRDPLARIQQLHPRWFEVFDLERGLLVEGETLRDARDLELELRRPLAAHRAPPPLTVNTAAGGHTEWFRGVASPLSEAVESLARRGHRVHAPLAGWLRDAMQLRRDLLHDWVAALPPEELDPAAGCSPAQRVVRDVLDAHVALGFELEPLLPERAWRWYLRRTDSSAGA
jgi:hypothetical protein